jgi:hypothetical protein
MSLHQDCKDLIRNPYVESTRLRQKEDRGGLSILTLVVYAVVFMYFVPKWLLDNGYMNLLFAYVPNVDLLANLFTYKGSPLPGHPTIRLYNAQPVTASGFLSTTVVSYYALLGLTYMVAYKTANEGLAVGWGDAFVVLLMTYLLPTEVVGTVMDTVYGYFASEDDLKRERETGKPGERAYWLALAAGAIATLAMIGGEAYIISKSSGLLRKLAGGIDKIVRAKVG